MNLDFRYFLPALLLVSACSQSALASNLALREPDVLEYGRAFQFYGDSTVNRLFIEVTGRLKLKGDDTLLEYLALAEHPRESVFNENQDAYTKIIRAAGGASSIAFIVEKSGRMVVARRYEVVTRPSAIHQCVSNPFRAESRYPPARFRRQALRELTSASSVQAAASRGRKVVGTAVYEQDGYVVTIDFPALLINIEPAASTKNQVEPQWQLVTRRMPVYVGGDPHCNGIRSGTAAIRRFSGPFDIVYLCPQGEGQLKRSDYSCTKRVSGRVRLFEVVQ